MVNLDVRRAAARLKQDALVRSSARIDALNSAVNTHLAWAQDRITCLAPNIEEKVLDVTRSSPMLEHVRVVATKVLHPVLEVLMPHIDSSLALAGKVQCELDEDESDCSSESWMERVPCPLILHELRQVAVWLSDSVVLKVSFICLTGSCLELTRRLGGAQKLRQVFTEAHIREVCEQMAGESIEKHRKAFQRHFRMLSKVVRLAQLGCERLLGDRLAECLLGDILKLGVAAKTPLDEKHLHMFASGIEAKCDDMSSEAGCLSEASEEQAQFRLIVKNSFIELVEDASPKTGMRRADTWSGPLCTPVNEPYVFTVTCSDVPQMVKSENLPPAVGCENEVTVVQASNGDEGSGEVIVPSTHDEQADLPTAVMLRNIPKEYTRPMIVNLMDASGFAGLYSFVHVPFDFTHQVGLGYATIVLKAPQAAADLRKFFDGFDDWDIPSTCVAEATWNEPRRTRDQYIERYRNSPVMHDSIPDEHRPALFEDGRQVPFPKPTKPIRRPRVRHTK